ncbi:SHOCT domain-containing protein [Nevskia sp.]|uniref:SHOCT domain-containing protein n=1 Tax=Nevskia sp. TaxID=1929292 RepID=UPI0025F3A2DE|nr:SHOCT domain-containing protein [Nevskia sp.]
MQQQLTPAGQNLVDDLSRRYGVSRDAVTTMLVAVNNGGGSMAQFWCGELGGGGQWMRGGMTMVGDMFNSGLRNTVDNLCNELSNALATMQLFPIAPAGSRNSRQWWPGDLGSPFSSGGQNNIRYAVFPNRLAVELNGQVTVYDTLNHSIGGVSQQQGNDSSLTFSSQFGTLSVAGLPIISGPGLPLPPQTNFAAPPAYDAPPVWQPDLSPMPATSSSEDVFALIEKLSRLHGVGALTDAEFNAKKSELLSWI